MSIDPWPFSDPYNTAVFTTRYVMDRDDSIIRVSHDAEDCACQFHGRRVSIKQAMVVALERVVQLDPTLSELADLPVGWTADRERPGAPWVRQQRRS